MKKRLLPAHRRPVISRRAFLRASLVVPSAALLAACADEQPAPTAPAAPAASSTPAAPQAAPSATALSAEPTLAQPEPTSQAALPPTPACADDDDETPAQTEGPFFTPSSPERTSLLEPGMAGATMVLVGTVLSTSCQPIAGALVDFWHADDAGQYDNVGYKLRGHQFTDDAGRYRLETIVPGLYPGRTRHFHVKVQAANQPVLTTQLYFPGEPDNQSDGIFDPALLMAVEESDSGKSAVFDFVLEV